MPAWGTVLDTRLIVLALGAFAGSMEASVVPGLLPEIGAETHASPSMAGYVVFGYSLTYAVAGPVLATLLGTFDRRRLLAAAELSLALCALLIALAPSLPLIVVARCLLAAAAVTFTSMAQATVVAISPFGQRGRALSVMLSGGTLAVAIGAPLGAFVALHAGWRVIYLAVAVLAGVAAITMWVRLPDGIVGERRPLRERLAVLGIPGVPRAVLVNLLFMAGAYLVIVYLAAITTHALGLSEIVIPFVLLANGIGSIVGGVLGGQLVDRLGPWRAVVVQILGAAVVLAGISAAALLPAPLVLPAWLLLIGLVGVTGWGVYTGQLALLAELAPQAVPLAVSLNLTAVNIGSATGALLGGIVVAQWGSGMLGLVGAALTLLAWAATLGARPRRAA